jgi:3-oxoacyl-[acyl-carrier-protein] synthase II
MSSFILHPSSSILPKRRVVLTGTGVVTPIGLDLPSFADNLLAGRGGVTRIASFDPSALPVQIGGEVRGFDPRNYLDKKDRKSLKMMVRTIQFAVASARLALEDAGLAAGSFDPARFGIAFGTGTIPGDPVDIGPAAQVAFDESNGHVDLARWGRDAIGTIPPMWMLNHVPNMPACHVSILNNLQGPNNTITQSDAAGLLALGEGLGVIRRDAADLMLAGGSDTRTNPISMIRYCHFGRLSKRNDDPEHACRPFDRDRDGQVVGEGAGAVVLEERGHALRRGARVRAEVLGFGAAFDRQRDGRGLARAVRAALADAGVSVAQLDHVNAHAAGAVVEDAWEARGLREAVGDVPVLAVKSYLGNLGPGGSTAELAASLVALERGTVPATRNYRHPDPACAVNVIREARPVVRDCVLKVACTERGQCAAVVLRRPQGG